MLFRTLGPLSSHYPVASQAGKPLARQYDLLTNSEPIPLLRESVLSANVPRPRWRSTSRMFPSRFARAPSEPDSERFERRLVSDSPRNECSVLPKAMSTERTGYHSCG